MGLIRDIPRNIPTYKLYGEHEQWLTPDMLHCETIAARSQLHNWQIKPHQHHGLFQILYLKNGSATIRLDEQQQEMSARQILLVPQMCIHGFNFARNAEGHVLTLTYPLLNKISRQIGDGLGALSRPQLHDAGSGGQGARIDMAFAELDHEYRRNAPHRDLLIESLLALILIWLNRNSAQAAPRQRKEISRREEHFAHFCELIESGYAGQHPVAHYAKQIGITAAHLNVLCRHTVGQSALDLIHERVLLEAKRNLVYTSMTVSVVSDTLGFSDPAYFTRFFKRATGMPPKAFRQQAKKVFKSGKLHEN